MSRVISIFLAVAPVVSAGGGMFLGTNEQHRSGAGHLMAYTSGSGNLLQDLETAMGADHRASTERRVARLEEAMRPIFSAMPKNSAGRLSASAARYMLHRVFVQRHGWFVKGLDLAGQSWNSSSPTDIINGVDHVQKVFDDRLEADGFDLHHAAVLAATLENFVHMECLERLQSAYKLTGISPDDDNVPEELVRQAMKTYMMMYVLDANYTSVSKKWINSAYKVIDQIYPTWTNTVAFVEEVRKAVIDGESNDDGDMMEGHSRSWSTALKVLETVGERYGKWQSQECHELKDALVTIEEGSSGRVPLDKFYASALNNVSWQFQESIPYLRSLGALDESNPERASVIIPNYINGPNNCVASSKYYSSCCIDECDALVGQLESSLASPDARPTDIIKLVEGLSSSTIQARAIPTDLKQRLSEIAEHHSGMVPLHGRLFAQWMHHAYPRECPYPHLSGTTNPVKPQNFQKETGMDIVANQEEMAEIVRAAEEGAAAAPPSEERAAVAWSFEEELYLHRPELDVKSRSWARMACVLGSSAVGLMLFVVRIFPKAAAGLMGDATKATNEKYFV